MPERIPPENTGGRVLAESIGYNTYTLQIARVSHDILLTWNCRHIADAAIMPELGEIVTKLGYELAILCTPEELLGD